MDNKQFLVIKLIWYKVLDTQPKYENHVMKNFMY